MKRKRTGANARKGEERAHKRRNPNSRMMDLNASEIIRACDKFLIDRGVPRNATEEYQLKQNKAMEPNEKEILSQYEKASDEEKAEIKAAYPWWFTEQDEDQH